MTRQRTRQPQAQDLRDRVGERIRQAQGARRNRDLADAVGIDVRLLQKHKAGDNMPSTENLARYARVLDKPLSYFFGDEAA